MKKLNGHIKKIAYIIVGSLFTFSVWADSGGNTDPATILASIITFMRNLFSLAVVLAILVEAFCIIFMKKFNMPVFYAIIGAAILAGGSAYFASLLTK
jgi:hypothetical protein